jgi:PmbA protein
VRSCRATGGQPRPGCWSHESLRDVSARRAAELLQEIRVGAEEVAGASFVRGSIAIGHRLVQLANTHETRREWRASYFCMAARAVAGKGGRRASVEIHEYGRNLDHLAPARLGSLVASQSDSALRGTPLVSGRYPVLLAPRVAARLLAGWAAVWCANPARATMPVGPAVTLVDDPLLDREIGSRPFDDEGVVCRRKVLIDRGTAVETLGDWRSAGQAGLGAAAAGNAVRGSYTQLPSPAPSVLALSPDQDRSGQLKDGIEDGLAVHRIHHGRGGVDVGRGIYQLPVSGRRIRRGELAEEVSGMVLAGSLSQFLSSVEAVGGELRCFGPIGCPSLRLAQAQLIRN